MDQGPDSQEKGIAAFAINHPHFTIVACLMTTIFEIDRAFPAGQAGLPRSAFRFPALLSAKLRPLSYSSLRILGNSRWGWR